MIVPVIIVIDKCNLLVVHLLMFVPSLTYELVYHCCQEGYILVWTFLFLPIV